MDGKNGFAKPSLGKSLDVYRAHIEQFQKRHPKSQSRNVCAVWMDKNA